LAAERENSILPPNGGATQASAIMAGDSPSEGNAPAHVDAAAEGLKDEGVKGTVQTDRPNKVAADSDTPATIAVTPEQKGDSDVDASHS